MYPELKVQNNANPNRFYAIPLIGMLIKLLILIPVFIEYLFLAIVMLFFSLVNPFIVLFTGKYWLTYYNWVLGLMRFQTKLFFFMSGLTDKYPGFDLSIHDTFSVDMPYPKTPRKIYAIPLLGWLVRAILLIPYTIYQSVINYAATIAVIFIASFAVLFKGKYPEAVYELQRDTNRLLLAITAYMAGLSDKYPSFWISMNHKTFKIVLIVVAVILMVMDQLNSINSTINQQ